MSDGPHRTLPMRRKWKRVAEWADNVVFEPEQVCGAIIPALEEDWRGEVSQEFTGSLVRVCSEHEGLLFKGDIAPALEALRGLAGLGMGRVAVDYAVRAAAKGCAGMEIAEKAIKDALADRAAKGVRQVEEHFWRESTKARGTRVRQRIEDAISRADIVGAARRLLNPETTRATVPSLKRQGVDDGVRL